MRSDDFNIEAAAAARLARNKRNPANKQIAAEGRELEIEIIGVAGELQASKELGLSPLSIKESKKLKGANFVIPKDGRVIQVSTSSTAPLYLPVPVSKAKYADVFVLAYYNEKSKKTKLIGWTDRATVLETELQRKISQRPNAPVNYLVHVNNLYPMETLIRDCRPTQQSLF
jgi:hypothetical protein